MKSARPPLVVLEVGTPEDLVAPGDVLRARGWELIDRLGDLPLRVERLVCRAVVDEDATASAAVLAASWGAGLLIGVGRLDPVVRDRLVDDLSRIAPLERNLPGSGPDIHPEAARLLDALATGITLGEAARDAFLSRRTADRRLADARRALGVASTTQALAAWTKGRREGRLRDGSA